MAWTKTQKQLAVRACREAGISEEQRVDMILRNFTNAHHGGDITSTSPKLSNTDYEAFMAIVENYAGGKVLHFTEGYWRKHAGDGLGRMRCKALALAAELERHGKLLPDGVGLCGWINKRVSGGQFNRVEELDYHGLLALILGLQSYARQQLVQLAS
jgi:hypothetical protein